MCKRASLNVQHIEPRNRWATAVDHPTATHVKYEQETEATQAYTDSLKFDRNPNCIYKLTNLQQPVCDVIMSTWPQISEKCFQHLVKTMPWRILKDKRGPTKYLHRAAATNERADQNYSYYIEMPVGGTKDHTKFCIVWVLYILNTYICLPNTIQLIKAQNFFDINWGEIRLFWLKGWRVRWPVDQRGILTKLCYLMVMYRPKLTSQRSTTVCIWMIAEVISCDKSIFSKLVCTLIFQAGCHKMIVFWL